VISAWPIQHDRDRTFGLGLAVFLPAVMLMMLGLTPAARAHDIGTTQITARFHSDGTYRIDIIVDPESLLARLEAAAGRELSGPLSAEQTEARIESLQATLLDTTKVIFNGERAQPTFDYMPIARDDLRDPSTGTRLLHAGLVRLSGRAPETARTFTWSYSLVYGTYLLTVQNERSEVRRQWLEGGTLSKPLLLSEVLSEPSRSEVAVQYLKLGITHIIPKGLDHILFVLGLFLLNTRLRPVLLQVTAFTLAHSITLALTIYGVVSLSPSIIEPLIALSIAYVAIENLLTSELRPWRVAVIFGFGLLHGMGFAGVLGELGLPRSEFVTALVTFNLGVEVGQLTVIGLAFVTVAQWSRKHSWYRLRVVVPASILIAAIGVYWTVQRLLM
jgi:hypothetical protein